MCKVERFSLKFLTFLYGCRFSFLVCILESAVFDVVGIARVLVLVLVLVLVMSILL